VGRVSGVELVLQLPNVVQILFIHVYSAVMHVIYMYKHISLDDVSSFCIVLERNCITLMRHLTIFYFIWQL